jgi:hypothetical protein
MNEKARFGLADRDYQRKVPRWLGKAELAANNANQVERGRSSRARKLEFYEHAHFPP